MTRAQKAPIDAEQAAATPSEPAEEVHGVLRGSFRPPSLLSKRPSTAAATLKYALRTAWASLSQVAIGVLAYSAVLYLAISGRLRPPVPNEALIVFAGVWVALLWRTFALYSIALERGASRSFSRSAQFEIGLLFIAASASLVATLGGYNGPMYPLFYALVAYFAVFLPWPEASFLFFLMVGLEGTHVLAASTPAQTYVSHLTFNGFFAVLYAVFLRGDLAQRRFAVKDGISRELEALYEDAREYRLVGALHLQDAEESEKRRVLGSVSAVREALYNLLVVGEKALLPRNLAVFVLDPSGTFLQLKEVRGFGEELKGGDLPAKEGVFGVMLTKKAPLCLTALHNYRGLTYYENEPAADAVTEFMGVPIFDRTAPSEPIVRGVMVCDRQNGKAFTKDELDLLESLAREVARTLEVERLFAQMDRERRGREKFFKASAAFASTRTIEDVADAAMQSAASLCDPALVCITTCNADQSEHVLRAARGKISLEVGETLRDPSALVATALKTKSVLPLPGVPIGEHSLFGKDLPVSGLTAARVFPLFAAGEPVGTWIVTTKKGQFAPNVEVMLHALSQQVATSLMNAKLNEAMERMATTDALTGLYNRRFFNQVFAERLGLAERYGRKLSVLLCDIDHFKSVNDTYGHPAGDAVLKVISRLLAQEARKADVVGRLGGEEFAVLMSETDAAGAKLTAERMRERIARELILTEHGKLKVTLSLGIATFPDDAGSADLLISRADEALYRAKHGGRNRSVAYGVK